MRYVPIWVVFDVGGVLFDYERAHADISKYLGISTDEISTQISSFLGNAEVDNHTFDNVWKAILINLDKPTELETVRSMWWDKKYWLSDSLELVRGLQTSGYKLAILTNNWRDMGPRLRVTKGIEPFQYFFESSILKMRKPDLPIYKHTEETIGAKGQEIFFIDDTLKNIETAKSIDWQTFHYILGNDNGMTSNNAIRKILNIE